MAASASVYRVTREYPPLRHHVEVITPTGGRSRWAADEPGVGNVINGLSFTKTMPGGDETCSGTLSRDPARSFPDLAKFSRLNVRSGSGRIVSQTRLEKTPSVSGDQMQIGPAAVGYQAELDDNEAARMIFVDADMTRWGAAPLNEQIRLATAGISTGDFSWQNDGGALACALPNQALPAQTTAQAWYEAPAGVLIDFIGYTGSEQVAIPAGYVQRFVFSTQDNLGGTVETQVPSLDGAPHTITPALKGRYVSATMYSNGTAATPAAGAGARFSGLSVYGNHGLPTNGGLYASDIVAYVLGRWVPKLSFTTGSDGTIRPSTFVIPHLIFPDLAKVSEMVKGAARFELPDWAVFAGADEEPTFYYAPRGTFSRKWTARVGEAKLSENGQQVDRIWNSVVVQYTDTGGNVRTVGPPGSGADTEDVSLVDTDPLNPANLAGETRRAALQMGISTAAGAIQVGARWLQEQKLLDTSGQATLGAFVQDDHGVYYSSSEVQPGDLISFADAADFSYRRIVRTNYDDVARTNQIDLDQPPDAMAAILERMQVVLVPIGVGS